MAHETPIQLATRRTARRKALRTHQGRLQIASELEAFLRRLYFGAALPSEARDAIAVLRGEQPARWSEGAVRQADEIREARRSVAR